MNTLAPAEQFEIATEAVLLAKEGGAVARQYWSIWAFFSCLRRRAGMLPSTFDPIGVA